MGEAIEILFLGTGTSTGVPQIGCDCPICVSDEPKNKRLRSSLYVTAGGWHVLIDSSPDLRQQALRENIRQVDAVLYTHLHTDHVGGFDDLRAFCWNRQGDLPIYGSSETLGGLQTMFAWAFDVDKRYAGYVRPEPHVVRRAFRLGAMRVYPLPVRHARVHTFGYLLEYGGRRLVYMPDVKAIPARTLAKMRGVDVLIIDGLRAEKHETHMCLSESLAAIAAVQPGRAYLTHLSHGWDYHALAAQLPPHVYPAYDGLRITLPLSPDAL